LASGTSEAEAYQQTLAELQERDVLAQELQRIERACSAEPLPL
jgi:ribosomal protein S12 methylthiotransferase accessory factor YcaO